MESWFPQFYSKAATSCEALPAMFFSHVFLKEFDNTQKERECLDFNPLIPGGNETVKHT